MGFAPREANSFLQDLILNENGGRINDRVVSSKCLCIHPQFSVLACSAKFDSGCMIS